MLDKARATLAGTNGEFDAVADPGKQYYRELGVEQSWAFAMHPRALWAAFRGMGSRFNLAMTGGPTGQPNQRTDFDVTDCRSARRFFGVGDDTDIGFRVVLVIGTQ
jgi:hypothetical protein